MIRAGVVGVGRLGREHARILSHMPGVRLAGLHDVREDRGEEVGAEVGAGHYPSLEGLLADVDAVVVAVPTVRHHQVARASLEAGCHALVEKPFASSVAEADDLIELAEERGLQLGVGHVERFNDAVRSARPFLEAPRFIESQRLAPYQPRGTEVPVILDLMIHDLDLILGLVRSPVASVHAVGTPVLTRSVDIGNARLVFENGTVAEITASRVSRKRVRDLRIFQPTGYLTLDLAAGSGAFLRRREAAVEEGEVADLGDVVERIPLVGDGREPLRLELEAFLQAIRGEDSPLVSAREGRAALELALKINREIERFANASMEAT